MLIVVGWLPYGMEWPRKVVLVFPMQMVGVMTLFFGFSKWREDQSQHVGPMDGVIAVHA